MATLRNFLFAGALFALVFMNAASAQTISIVQGSGQLLCDLCPTGNFNFFDDMVVRVTDANGKPLAGQTITWSVLGDGIDPLQGSLDNTTQTTTSSNTNAGAALCDQIGNSCNRYSGSDTHGRLLRTVTITATLSNGQPPVTFYLSETPVPSNGGTVQNATVTILDPSVNTQFQGTAGSVSSTPIDVSVGTQGGNPIPNVSVRLVPDPSNAPGDPVAACKTQAGADPGSVLTDSTGHATCNLVFGSIPSTGTPPTPVPFRVLVGGVPTVLFLANVQQFGSAPAGFAEPGVGRFLLIVTPATPNAVQIISGNNQTANRGQALASPLVVQVTDANSNPLQSAAVTWSAVPAGAALVAPAAPTTDANGKASATITLQNTASGPIQVTATTANGKSVTFTESVNVQISGLTIVASTNNQSVNVGQAFQPIAVQVIAGGSSPLGISVQFAVTGGTVTLAQSSATADANGLAAVGVQAGTTAGPVTITASVGTFSVTFNLTVLPPGLNLTAANFLNGAGFFATGDKNIGALSPCSIGTVVVGTPLNPAALPAVPSLFGVAMQQPSGAAVKFNSESAPILGVFGNTAQTLITFQVPCDVAPGSVPVTVTLNNASTLTPVNVTVRSASPGFFELPMSDGVRRAVAVRPDGTFVSLENPARRGEIIRIYITGIGPTSPPLITNALPTPGVDSLSTAAFLVVELGTTNVPVVSSSRASPALLGVYELDIPIPANAPTGNNVFLEVGVLVTNPGDYQFAQPGVGSKIPIQ